MAWRQSSVWTRLLGCLIPVALFGAAACSSAGGDATQDPGPAGLEASAGRAIGQSSDRAGTTDPSDASCIDGATRECHVTLGRHGGILSCFHGVQVCDGGAFGPCSEGSAVDEPDTAAEGALEAAGEAAGDGAEGAKLLSLSDAMPCLDNPCDPTCKKFVELPDGGVLAEPDGSIYEWVGGSLGDYPPDVVDEGLVEPCYTGSDCQFNTRCQNPGKGTCAHHQCAEGAALDSQCNPCVQAICAQDPTCCEPPYYGTCLHDPCQAGSRLKKTCDPCVEDICDVDPFCCVTQWDALCVAEVTSVCGKSCPTGSWSSACVEKVHSVCNAFCEEDGSCAHDKCYAGKRLDPACDPCVHAICTTDPYCCSPAGRWDDVCVSEVATICGQKCPEIGRCLSWHPGDTDADCPLPDLALGPPCQGTLQVCNHGAAEAPAGIPIVHLPPDSGQYPSCNPDVTVAGAVTCTTAEPIAPGTCINVPCPGLDSGREIVVNPVAPGHVDECFCQDNWALYEDVPCGNPSCSAASSQSSLIPVNLFMAIDRSGSMAKNGWTECMNAVKAFVQDPKSAGLGVALRFWPDPAPTPGCDTSSCNQSACSQPLVPLGALTSAAAPTDTQEKLLVDAINAKSPSGGTPMKPALAGALQWAIDYQLTHPGEKTGVLLITDGEPTHCDTSIDAIIGTAASAYQIYGVRTYVIGIELAYFKDTLDEIAHAGGTGQAYLVPKGNNGAANAALLAALEEIRGNQVACELDLPNPGAFDPSQITVEYSSKVTAKMPLPQVWSQADCGDGWYYDDWANPTKVTLCPATCAAARAEAGAEVRIEVGCPGIYDVYTYTETYFGECPPGTEVQWGYFSYESSTPGDSEIVFQAGTTADPNLVITSPATLAIASQGAGTQSCPMSGPSPCPIDLVAAFGPAEAKLPYLQLRMTLKPTSDQSLPPIAKTWKVTYSCPNAE